MAIKRLIGFECEGGGYDWFGRGPANTWLTAYGVMEFTDMKEVYPHVSQKMLDKTKNWLLQQRTENGKFTQLESNRYRYNETYQEILNAYTVWALASAGESNLGKAYKLGISDALKSEDAYLMGLMANAAYKLGNIQDGNQLLEKLENQIKENKIGLLKASRSISYGRGQSLQVEVASLITLALLQTRAPDFDLINQLVKYIASKNQFGGYGNTQATILALKALTEYTQKVALDYGNGTLSININNDHVITEKYNKKQKTPIVLTNLGSYFTKNEQKLKIEFIDGTTKSIPYSFNISYTSYTPNSHTLCAVDLNTTLTNNKTKVGETIRLTSNLKNKANEQQGMAIALVGIPSGLSPQPWQLKELQEKQVFDYYEVRENYVVFYYTTLAPNETKTVHLDLKAEIPGNYQAPASTAYLYYTDEYKDWEKGTLVTISK